MRSVALALLALSLAAPTSAQIVVAPGDPSLDTSHITAGQRRFVVRLTSPMRQDIGTFTETITVDGDRVTRASLLDVPMGGQLQRDSSVAVLAGLVPVFSSTSRTGAGPAGSEETTFMGDHAMTRVTTGPTTVDSTVALAAPVFGAGWASEIVRALPLAAGYSAAWTSLDAADGPGQSTATVTGSESVQTPAGPVEAWTVAVVRDGRTNTYAIAKASRDMLAMRFAPQPGATVEVVPAP